MCFGIGNDSNRVKRAQFEAQQQQAELRRREEERQAKVQAGREGIDSAFEQFDDDFFTGFTDAFKNSQLPSLDRQFGDARGKLIAALAGRGTLESTVGADALADLQLVNDNTRADIGNQATDAANDLRSRIESSKSNLYSLNTGSTDPAQLNTQALASASALAAPPTTTALGDVFSSAISPFIAFQSASNNRVGPRSQSVLARGTGSGTVVK